MKIMKSNTTHRIMVKVCYLGYLYDSAGTKEERLPMQEPVCINAVLAQVAQLHPRITKIKDTIFVTVNGTQILENVRLYEGDTVVLIAPVAGG